MARPHRPGFRVLATVVFALAGWSCSKNTSGPAIEATVNVDPAAQSTCVRVSAQSAGQAAVLSSPIQRGSQNQFIVAIYPTATLSGQVTLLAMGYIGANCDTQIEQSAPQTSSFQPGTIQQVTLILSPAACESGCTTSPGGCYASTGACADGGACAYAPADAGTPCTSDMNPCHGNVCDGNGSCVHPFVDAGTACTDDMNSCTTDVCGPAGTCLHVPVDAGAVCSSASTCTSAGTCDSMGNCLDGGQFVCNTPPGQCYGDAGMCTIGTGCSYPVTVDAGCALSDLCQLNPTCQASGACVGTPMVCDVAPGQCFTDAGVCVSGACTYATLSTSTSCNTGDPCLVNGLCEADGGCQGTPVVCDVSPGQCFSDAGVCVDGGCDYPVFPGTTPCNTGDLCLLNGMCAADGGCPGTPMVCDVSPGQCYSDAGSCSGGACSYPPLTGSSCTTGDQCLMGQTCNAGVCSGGSPISCPSKDCFAGVCSVSSGCGYVQQPVGSSCSNGGVCSLSGVCFTQFQYAPSNFDAGMAAAGTIDVAAPVVINCPVTFDSTPDASNGPWCDAGVPPQMVIVQSGSGASAMLLAVAGLDVTDAGSLTLQGTLPVILAVYGTADVEGFVNASATGADAGVGYSLDAGCNAGSGQGSGTAGASGGGGGGAGFSQAGSAGGAGAFTGGGAAGTTTPTGTGSLQPILAGCPGGDGGTVGGGAGGQGGAGGGAFQLSVASTLLFDGGIFAEGGGGRGGKNGGPSGGGGGGSGGTILIEAQTMAFGTNPSLTANGGGGGGGSTNGAVGPPGGDGSDTTKTPAAGGNGPGAAGNGGTGGAGNTAPGAAQVGGGGGAGGGGGGGGGGEGRIYLNVVGGCTPAAGTGVMSPNPGHSTGNCP